MELVKTEMISEPVAKLRESVQTRFKKSVMGYETAMVDQYVSAQQQASKNSQKKLEQALAERDAAQNCADAAKREFEVAAAQAEKQNRQLREALQLCTEALEAEQNRASENLEQAQTEIGQRAKTLETELEMANRAAQEAAAQLQVAQKEKEQLALRLTKAAEDNRALAEAVREAREEAEALRGRVTQSIAGVEAMRKYRAGELQARLGEAITLLQDGILDDLKDLDTLRAAVAEQKKSPL